MTLKSVGGAGMILGALIVLAALAQPATVSDSATTCVDTVYYGQDCSTVSYESPNYGRAQLLGAGVFVFVASGFAYAVGASGRSAGSTSNSTPPTESGRTDRSSSPAAGTTRGVRGSAGETTLAEDGMPDAGKTLTEVSSVAGGKTLREQLEERTNPNERHPGTASSAVGASETGTGSVRHDGHRSDAEMSSDLASRRTGRIRTAIVVTGIGLGSAFALSAVGSLATSVPSPGYRAAIFAIFAIPGLVAYYYYAAAHAPGTGVDTP